MKNKKPKIWTTKQIAEYYKVDQRDVLYALNHGHLNGTKIGWIWVVFEDELPEVWPVRKRG